MSNTALVPLGYGRGRLRRVGGTREIPVDVRIVSATHQDLRQMAGAGRFRDDLYFRLACYSIQLPPLRDRGRDVVRIARHLLRHDAELLGDKPWRLTRDAEDALLRHRWPGNVRELRNVLVQLVVDVRGARIHARHVRDALGDRGGSPEEHADLDEAIVGLTRQRTTVSSAELCAELGLSKSAAQRRLRRLCQAGRLEKTGAGARCRYLLASGLRVGAAPGAREEIALALARDEGMVTRRSLSVAASVSERTASRVLKGLVATGRMICERRGRDARYATAAPTNT
jgi:sigma54-dependent transcription regulator